MEVWYCHHEGRSVGIVMKESEMFVLRIYNPVDTVRQRHNWRGRSDCDER